MKPLLRKLFVAGTVTAATGTMLASALQAAHAAPTNQYLIATGARAGGSPHVRLFKANGDATSTSFWAYDPNFHGGVEVALGDLDGDNTPEIVTAPGPGGGPHVRVFDIHGVALDKWAFMAYDSNLRTGIHVATADTDGDGKDEILTAPASGAGPHVKVTKVNANSVTTGAGFFAFDASFSGGVFVAGIDAGAAGNKDSILVGAGPGAGPHVKVVPPNEDVAHPTASFFAYDAKYTGGVAVAGADIANTGTDRIVTSSLAFSGHARSFAADGTDATAGTFAFPSPGNTGATVASFNQSGAPSVLAAQYRSGATILGLDADSHAVAPVIHPYGNTWNGGVNVAGGYGLFEDTAPPASTTTTVAPVALSVTTTALDGAVKDAAYSDAVEATGGKTPYTWSITAGTLPAGLTLNPATGAITGTPTATGTSTFTVKVTDSTNGTPSTATKELSITVTDGLTVTTASLPDAIKDSSYSQSVAAAGGTGTKTWLIDSGALPAGLSLNPATGAITGTPTTAGTSNFTVKVVDSSAPAQTATKALSIKVVVPLSIATGQQLPDGVVGDAYSTTIVPAGGQGPYTFAITGGALPAGLTLNTSTGVISGTPTTEQAKNVTIKVTDSTSGTAQTATKTFNIAVYQPLQITTASLPNGTQNTPYSQSIATTGGNAPLAWSISAGALPTGVTINATTGQISGTPTATGTYNFTVKAIDSSSPAQSATHAYAVTIS